MRVLILALLGALVGGLSPLRAQEVGSGELWLHESVWKYYEEFERDQNASYFAVSTNGVSAGYSYCPGMRCRPLDGKRQAIQGCTKDTSDLPGTCYLFANSSRVLWDGEVHVLSDAEFMAHLYGPDSIDTALAEFTTQVTGPVEGTALVFKPTATVWSRADFRFAPTGLKPQGDECRYAYSDLYQPNGARNFFLLDATGRYCAFSTGFAPSDEAAAFERALAACQQLAADGHCVVYAAGGMTIAGLARL